MHAYFEQNRCKDGKSSTSSSSSRMYTMSAPSSSLAAAFGGNATSTATTSSGTTSKTTSGVGTKKSGNGGKKKIPFFNWLDYLYLLSYVKVLISLIKYIPQVILNYQRKSTLGWSIWNIILDFTGGLLSDLQLVFDCAMLHDWWGITGNIAKFGLGFVSILFDIIFMFQHYGLYGTSRNNNSITGDSDDPAEEPLLARHIEHHNVHNNRLTV